MTLKKKIVDELKTSIEVLQEQIEVSKVVLQKKNIPATGENVLKAAQILATNLLVTTSEESKKPE